MFLYMQSAAIIITWCCKQLLASKDYVIIVSNMYSALTNSDYTEQPVFCQTQGKMKRFQFEEKDPNKLKRLCSRQTRILICNHCLWLLSLSIGANTSIKLILTVHVTSKGSAVVKLIHLERYFFKAWATAVKQNIGKIGADVR